MSSTYCPYDSFFFFLSCRHWEQPRANLDPFILIYFSAGDVLKVLETKGLVKQTIPEDSLLCRLTRESTQLSQEDAGKRERMLTSRYHFHRGSLDIPLESVSDEAVSKVAVLEVDKVLRGGAW